MNSGKINASIIVTSYNQQRTLEFLLASLKRQTLKNFEVVVADDGSSDKSRSLCEKPWGFPIDFVTQADEGYRKAKIVNQAIKRSNSDYLIFLDADVILEKHFVEDHLRLKNPDHFVCGRRVDLGASFSEKIEVADILKGRFDQLNLSLMLSGLFKDTLGLKRSLRIVSPLFRRLLGYHRSLDMLGSNFSAWKADLLKVNGFNEAIETYWGEDGDLFIRLRNSGKKSIGAKAVCVQYHVFHPRREPTLENVLAYQRLESNDDYCWAKHGYSENY
jgi:glycosyltransferase involved in cell wall biosynthesis